MGSFKSALLAGASLSLLTLIGTGVEQAAAKPLELAQAEAPAVTAAQKAVEDARAMLRKAMASGKDVNQARAQLKAALDRLKAAQVAAGEPPTSEPSPVAPVVEGKAPAEPALVAQAEGDQPADDQGQLKKKKKKLPPAPAGEQPPPPAAAPPPAEQPPAAAEQPPQAPPAAAEEQPSGKGKAKKQKGPPAAAEGGQPPAPAAKGGQPPAPPAPPPAAAEQPPAAPPAAAEEQPSGKGKAKKQKGPPAAAQGGQPPPPPPAAAEGGQPPTAPPKAAEQPPPAPAAPPAAAEGQPATPPPPPVAKGQPPAAPQPPAQAGGGQPPASGGQPAPAQAEAAPPPPPPPPPPADKAEGPPPPTRAKGPPPAMQALQAPPPGQDGAIAKANDGRVIFRQGGQMVIRHDEYARFRQQGAQFAQQKGQGGTTVETVNRPNGVQLVTVRDQYGNIIRRERRAPGQQVVILIDNQPQDRHQFQQRMDYLRRLPPLRPNIPEDEYIVESQRATPQQIYGALMAPPVERVEQPYTLDEIRLSGRLRDKVPRVDVDTINFDFGQASVPPDQIGRLNVIGDTLKRIIQKDPREVFMIEGHTDAVGNEMANLALSDRRAESVAEILTYYYQIPPENLVTQGYGEQYLKVPTEAAERENRRVTLRRITPLLVGQNQ